MVESIEKSTYLVTGAAGFIGFHVCSELLRAGHRVVGLDNMNEYYSTSLKEARLERLTPYPDFVFHRSDLAKDDLKPIFEGVRPEYVVHLAAQAGVRYSLVDPDAYIDANINGFFRLLEACRAHPVRHLVYASSSSVYGDSNSLPFRESDNVDRPVSLYAATKKSNELMGYTYSHLYNIPMTGLRFFTVYGPWGRPDMAYYSFTESYSLKRSIAVYNSGDEENDLLRDFTYIDDVVTATLAVSAVPPTGSNPHRVLNIGNKEPVRLSDFISHLEGALSSAYGIPIEFEKRYEAIKPGDVRATYADTRELEALTGVTFNTPLRIGLGRFADWYKSFHGDHLRRDADVSEGCEYAQGS